MKQSILRLTILVLLWSMTVVALADSDSKAKTAPAGPSWVKQTVTTCAGCHGPKGVSQVPTFPMLAGQYESYLYHALTAYRDGDRKNAIMSGMVQGKTDAQLKALARYFSRQSSPLHTPLD